MFILKRENNSKQKQNPTRPLKIRCLVLRTSRDSFRKLAIPFISLVILIFIFLQSVGSFGPYAQHLYPFLDYPMYNRAHYKGDTINQYFLFGILEDSTEVSVLPSDLGLNYWKFIGGVVGAMRHENKKMLQTYVQLYRSRQNILLSGFRLVNHPIALSREGITPVPSVVVKTIRLETHE